MNPFSQNRFTLSPVRYVFKLEYVEKSFNRNISKGSDA